MSTQPASSWDIDCTRPPSTDDRSEPSFNAASADRSGRSNESCACPLCGDVRQRSSRYGQGEWRVVRCVGCATWYLSPRLTEAAMRRAYEQDDYFEGGHDGYDSYALQEPALRSTFAALLQRMKRRGLASGGRLLDVGCGYGYLLDEARGFFDFRAGTEMSAAAAARAGKVADAVYRGGLDAIPPGAKFDCVTALHVIEHVYDPVPFVAGLSRLLDERGVLILAAPNMGGFWRRLMGRRWPSFKFPEHVVHYDYRSLASLVRRAGLRLGGRLAYPHAFPVQTVCEKLSLPCPRTLTRRRLWIPATTVAVFAHRSAEGAP